MICPIYFFSGRDDTSMRKRQFRFAGIILFALVIIPVSAFAGTIDDLLTQLSYPAEKPAEVTCRIEAVSIPQFSETRTGWLNGLLKHMSFRIRSDGIIQEEEIDVDDKPVIQCKTRETEGRTETLFPFDDRIYITEGTDLTELLTGISPEADMTEYYTEIRVLLPEFYRFFSGLPELFPDSVSESKVSIKYKGYGTAVKRYAMVLSQDVISDEKMNGYLENKELIPGGLRIPGRTLEESDIPELKDSLKKLPRGTFVDLQVNGTQYTAIQGFFTEDYETCKNETRDNTLGIRLPDAAAIPADYSEHLSFTVGYYMTDKDYASRKELNSEKTERYALQTWLLPETVKDQIGQYALEWFRTDKKPITCTAHLAATDEMYIPTTDASVTVRPLTVRGFDKALYLEQYNAAFDAQEISVMLWQRIDPVTVLTPGFHAAPVLEEKHYIVYILDAVGLTEEEAVRIAEAW